MDGDVSFYFSHNDNDDHDGAINSFAAYDEVGVRVCVCACMCVCGVARRFWSPARQPARVVRAPAVVATGSRAPCCLPRPLLLGRRHCLVLADPLSPTRPPSSSLAPRPPPRQLVMACGDRTTYPNLRKILIVGFSAGGQFVQRYALGGMGASNLVSAVDVAYFVLSPSSYVVFFCSVCIERCFVLLFCSGCVRLSGL